MHKRLVLLFTLFAALLAFSCTKLPIFEFDLEGVEGKWLVTSTTGKMAIDYGHYDDIVFAVNDTVRFFKIRDNLHRLFVSRPDENRYYDEDLDLHYYMRIGYSPNEDKKSFNVIVNRTQTFELLEATKETIVFGLADNGAKAVLKKEE
ncbi:MAG: hypothetical protein J5646_01700 [Bacteroidales bacterium]|nr:hypothetical protein [Bacteroidales bacterium]